MFDLGILISVLLMGVVAWLLADPDRRQCAAAWLACGWVLPSAAFLGYMSTQLGIWPSLGGVLFGPEEVGSWTQWSVGGRAYSWSHVMIFSMPVIVLVWRVVIWGWVPALLFPKVNMPWVYAFGVLADRGLFLVALPGVHVGVTSAVFQTAVAAACLLPAQYFCRWTRERSHLSARSWMHFIFHGTLLLGVLSMLILSLSGGFGGPSLRSSMTNKFLVQLILIPAVLLASAMREFYLGGGTPMPADAPLKLIETGPYAYIANPMQIGKFGVLVTWAIFWSSPAIFAAAFLGLLYSLTIACPREDREMLARFGGQWTRYRSEVRRWRPRWRPYRAGANSTGESTRARLYLDENCGTCAELTQWVKRQNPVGLQVLPIFSHSASNSGKMTYLPDGGGRVELGIRALSRGFEHINFFWAFCGWAASIPGVSWFAQLILDDVTSRRAKRTCTPPAVSPPVPSSTRRVP